MKYNRLFPLLALCLILAACGPNEPASSVSSGGSTSVSGTASSIPDASRPDPGASEPDASVPEPSLPDASAVPAPLSEEDKAAAYDAAMDYYLGTVFEVHTLTERDPLEGEISFQVRCSKDGVPVDPDRTISLERRNGTWTVVNEGY